MNRKSILLLLGSLSFITFANADEPSPDDILKQGIFNTFHVQVSSYTAETFRQWFFSDDFEKQVRGNKQGLSVTIPIYGVPVTFGGSNESNDAWQKRSIKENQQKWDITNDTWQSVFIRSADPTIVNAWKEAEIAYINRQGRQPQRLHVSVDQNTEGFVTVSINRDHFEGAPEPLIVGFSTPGLQPDPATLLLKGAAIGDGRAGSLAWLKDAESGSIIIETQVGDASPVAVIRPVTRAASLTYSTTATQWLPANWTSQQVTTDNRDGMHADGRAPTSPDGKWWASEKTVTLQAAPNERLTNAAFTWVSGAGPFTEPHGPFYNQDASTVTATVKGWSGPTTYELKAQIERQTSVQQQHTTSLLLKGNPFTISVPRNAADARFTMAYHNLLLTVTFGSQPNSPLSFVGQKDNGDSIDYTYQIKE